MIEEKISPRTNLYLGKKMKEILMKVSEEELMSVPELIKICIKARLKQKYNIII